MHRSRAIASARAFLGLPTFDIVADIVGMNPQGNWRLWKDSEGNCLRITKKKSVHSKLPLLPLEITKDVFRKARPELIAKHSYWLLSFFGNINGHQHSIFAFLGYDGYLRCCLFRNNVWCNNFSPILLGFQALSYISSEYIDNESRLINSMKIMYPKGFLIEQVWASGLPIIDTTLQERIQCHLINQSLKV
jgi:hypothetical protein